MTENSTIQDENTEMILADQRADYQNMVQKQNEVERLEKLRKKIKMGVIIVSVVLLLAVTGDIIELVTGGTIGWAVGIVIDVVLSVILGLSKNMKKQWKKWLTSFGLDSIPIIDVLPFRTIGVVWAFLSSRQEAKKIEKEEVRVANA